MAAKQAQEAAKQEAIQTQLSLRLASDNLDIRKEALNGKKVSESISFKDLPVDGQLQMAHQAGILLHPEGLRQKSQQDQQAKKQSPFGKSNGQN
jgi:hypothetical protein